MNASSKFPIVLAFVLGLGAPPAAHAQQGGQHKTVLMTRLMLVFSQVEGKLADAIGKKDAAAIDRLLSADFELSSPDVAGGLMARADWLAGAAAAQPGDMDQLSVREHADLAIASYVWTNFAGERSYVVDAWKKHGNGWQLLTRYQSPLPPVNVMETDVAPTGKG